MKIEQPMGLISVLLDNDAPLGDRLDAAEDLYRFDEPEVENALLEIAFDLSGDDDLADAAGESLWTIWHRQGRGNTKLADAFHPEARKFFVKNSLDLNARRNN